MKMYFDISGRLGMDYGCSRQNDRTETFRNRAVHSFSARAKRTLFSPKSARTLAHFIM